MQVTFEFLENNNYYSVTDYCRDLVRNNHPEEKIEVYRGEMLCLTVPSIYEGARWEPDSKGGFKLYNRPSATLEPRTAI